jgi:hypothetical protein
MGKQQRNTGVATIPARNYIEHYHLLLLSHDDVRIALSTEREKEGHDLKHAR